MHINIKFPGTYASTKDSKKFSVMSDGHAKSNREQFGTHNSRWELMKQVARSLAALKLRLATAMKTKPRMSIKGAQGTLAVYK
jgi:hypothetical protein